MMWKLSEYKTGATCVESVPRKIPGASPDATVYKTTHLLQSILLR